MIQVMYTEAVILSASFFRDGLSIPSVMVRNIVRAKKGVSRKKNFMNVLTKKRISAELSMYCIPRVFQSRSLYMKGAIFSS